jgi:hypothetical protein
MKILNIILTLGVLGSVSSARAAWWAPILSCDNGSAVIDIDLGERRNTQLIIRDAKIISYFNQSGVALTGTSWLVWDGRLHNLTNNANETVIPAQMYSGVFQANQFRGFSSPLSYNGRQFNVYRSGNGLKVEVIVPGYGAGCGGDFDSGGGCNNPYDGQPEQNLANWYFQNCQELATPN